MTATTPEAPNETEAPRRPPAPRLGLSQATTAIVLAMAAAFAVILGGLDTPIGHRLLLASFARLTLSDGLNFRARRLEGSIYSHIVLRDLQARDVRGLFAIAPVVSVDWRPGELLAGRLNLKVVRAREIDLLRLPALKIHAPRPDQPVLPRGHLSLGRLDIGALRIGPAGRSAPPLSVQGGAELQNERLRLRLDARSLAAAGERLHLALDAEPRADRLGLDAHLAAPAGGAADALLGLHRPLAFDLAGQGAWRSWSGAAAARLGGVPALDARVSASQGEFEVQGRMAPSLFLRTTPVLSMMDHAGFDARAYLVRRRLSFALGLAGRGVLGQAGGHLDLARNRFEAVAARARLADPRMLGRTYAGRDLAASLKLDGRMDGPAVGYALSAAELDLNKIKITRLDAVGAGHGAPGRPLDLDIVATAARLDGLPPIVEPIVEQVRVSGPWRLDGLRILATGATLTSSRLAAKVDIDLQPVKGLWQASAKGHVARYPLAGVGPIDLDLDARFTPTARDRFTIAGGGIAHTDGVDDATLRALFGGQAQAQAKWSVDPLGAVAVSGFTLAAPRLKVTSGALQMTPLGVMSLAVEAASTTYGALHLQGSGPAMLPTLRLQAPRPDIADLTDLDATMSTTGHSLWILAGHAASPLGPVTADARLDFSGKDLGIDLTRGHIGEIGLSGPLTIQPPGVLAGELRVAGSGFTGGARLSGQNGLQRIDAQLTAHAARLDARPKILIASGEASVGLLLKPGEPLIEARATLSGVQRGAMKLAQARLEVAYHDGAGHIVGSVRGEDRFPFDGAGTIDLAPDLVRVSGAGVVNKVAVRLAAPAEMRKVRQDWVLSPATLVLPSGRLTLTGRAGPAGVSARAQLASVDLAIVRAADPDLAISGVASGSASFALPDGGTMPTGQADLQIRGFSRAALTSVTEPVDVALIASLTPTAGEAHAIVRRRGVVVGRLQTQLSPIPAGRDWRARLAAAPVSGGVRWNGPAEALWGLTGITGYAFSGPLAVGMDVSGTIDKPQVRGIVQGEGLRFVDESLGAGVDQVALAGRFTDDRFELTKFSGRAGEGTVSMSGTADLAASEGFPVDLRIVLDRARIARNSQLAASVSGQLEVANDRAHGARIVGKLALDQASYRLGRTGVSETPELTGVRRKGEALLEPIAASAAPLAPSGPPSAWKLNIGLAGGGAVRVTGMGLDAQWRPALTITGDARHPVLSGEIDLMRGDFTFAGRMLGLTRGVIRLNGADPPDPTLDIQASTTVEGVTANVLIAGVASHPEVTFTSSPPLPQDEVLSRLLFGASAANINPVQAVELAASLNELRGGSGGLKSLSALQHAAGLRFYAADKTTGRGAAFGAGRSITRNIYVEITSDTRGYAVTQIEIALSRALRLLSQVGTVGGSNLSLRYTKDY
jgi:translocation and assembly module TamB